MYAYTVSCREHMSYGWACWGLGGRVCWELGLKWMPSLFACDPSSAIDLVRSVAVSRAHRGGWHLESPPRQVAWMKLRCGIARSEMKLHTSRDCSILDEAPQRDCPIRFRDVDPEPTKGGGNPDSRVHRGVWHAASRVHRCVWPHLGGWAFLC